MLKLTCNNNIEIRFNYILKKYSKDIEAAIRNYRSGLKEDLYQEIKLKLWELARCNKLRSSRRFIIRISNNAAVDYIKKNKSYPQEF